MPLDDVIMPPDMLISLIGSDFERVGELAGSYKAAYEAANQILSEHFDGLETRLMERVEQNYADYVNVLESFGTTELIEMSAKIHAMRDAHEYMTEQRAFTDEELLFYMQFQNPLEVVADHWCERNADFDEMSFAMDYVYEHGDTFTNAYALTKDLDGFIDTDLRRFMGVDLLDFLGKIADKVIIHYPGDWQIDKDALYRAATSNDPDERRLVWHVCSFGTHIRPEREVFIRDTGAFNCMTEYRQNEPDMFGYFVEVTGHGEGGNVIGNVFEVSDYKLFARHIKEEALPLDSVILTYSNDWGVNAGKKITVPRFEYDDDRNRLMCESGNVVALGYIPAECDRTMEATLQYERSRRMSYPIGSQEAHLEELSAKLAVIRAELPDCEPSPQTAAKSAFTKALERGQEKTDAYKAQKPSEPANHDKHIGGERTE